jgi:tetratricopeptide (TPR) repeat protein
MRRHGAAVAQVCPLCRGAMPDAERLRVEAGRLLTQYERWRKGQRGGAPLPAAVQGLVGKAVALCREALAIDPADAQAHYLVGYALSEGGDKAGTEAAYLAAIAADPQHANAHYNLGVLLSERGDKAGAEAAWRAAIAADPQYVDAHCNLGSILGSSGDHAGAARSFAAALKIDPSAADAKANLQLALCMLKEERREA